MRTYRIKSYKILDKGDYASYKKTLYTIEITKKTIGGFIRKLLGEKDVDTVFDREVISNYGYIFTDTGQKVFDYDFSLWEKLTAFEDKLEADEIIKNSLT